MTQILPKTRRRIADYIIPAGIALAFAGAAYAGADTTFDPALTKFTDFLEGSGGKIITVLSLAGGIVGLASGRFSLAQVAIPVGVGVGAGTGVRLRAGVGGGGADHRLPLRARPGHANVDHDRHRPRRADGRSDQERRGFGALREGRYADRRQDRHPYRGQAQAGRRDAGAGARRG